MGAKKRAIRPSSSRGGDTSGETVMARDRACNAVLEQRQPIMDGTPFSGTPEDPS